MSQGDTTDGSTEEFEYVPLVWEGVKGSSVTFVSEEWEGRKSGVSGTRAGNLISEVSRSF